MSILILQMPGKNDTVVSVYFCKNSTNENSRTCKRGKNSTQKRELSAPI